MRLLLPAVGKGRVRFPPARHETWDVFLSVKRRFSNGFNKFS